jgi:hypothetical protein
MPPPPAWLLVTTICAYWTATAFKCLFWVLARRGEARTQQQRGD